MEQLSHLLENTLRWIKGQSTEIRPYFEQVTLQQIVQETVSLFEPGARRKQVDIQANILNSVMVVVDEQMIRLVLRNLISNSIKFCRPGDRIYVSAREAQDMLIISVDDTGKGIKASDIPELFTLSHVSTMGTNNEVGMGLGLTLCKEFIERMGGEIRVTSVEGKGSCFEFTVHTPTTATPEFLNFIESTETESSASRNDAPTSKSHR